MRRIIAIEVFRHNALPRGRETIHVFRPFCKKDEFKDRRRIFCFLGEQERHNRNERFSHLSHIRRANQEYSCPDSLEEIALACCIRPKNSRRAQDALLADYGHMALHIRDRIAIAIRFPCF